MADAGNSCVRWKSIISKDLPKKCERNCLEPLNGPCSADYKIVTHVATQVDLDPLAGKDGDGLAIVKAILKPEVPIRKLIDIKTPCSTPRSHYFKSEKCCKLIDAQNATHINNFCSTECRPLSTLLHLQEFTNRPRPKPTYKHSVFLKPDLFVGRVFPVKLRIRRDKNQCLDCGKNLYIRDPITDNDNVIVLDNCCDVKVYTNTALENWHRVPILSISGKESMKKKTINEVCKLERKIIPMRRKSNELSIIHAKIEEPKVKKKGKKK